ncbi:MAG: hypothetical protein ACFKPT_25025 [Gloeotrichia echinulata GP01]
MIQPLSRIIVKELLPAGGYLLLVPAAVWLGESYQALGDVGASTLSR